MMNLSKCMFIIIIISLFLTELIAEEKINYIHLLQKAKQSNDLKQMIDTRKKVEKALKSKKISQNKLIKKHLKALNDAVFYAIENKIKKINDGDWKQAENILAPLSYLNTYQQQYLFLQLAKKLPFDPKFHQKYFELFKTPSSQNVAAQKLFDEYRNKVVGPGNDADLWVKLGDFGRQYQVEVSRIMHAYERAAALQPENKKAQQGLIKLLKPLITNLKKELVMETYYSGSHSPQIKILKESAFIDLIKKKAVTAQKDEKYRKLLELYQYKSVRCDNKNFEYRLKRESNDNWYYSNHPQTYIDATEVWKKCLPKYGTKLITSRGVQSLSGYYWVKLNWDPEQGIWTDKTKFQKREFYFAIIEDLLVKLKEKLEILKTEQEKLPVIIKKITGFEKKLIKPLALSKILQKLLLKKEVSIKIVSQELR